MSVCIGDRDYDTITIQKNDYSGLSRRKIMCKIMYEGHVVRYDVITVTEIHKTEIQNTCELRQK
jgi:hypothetical protein